MLKYCWALAALIALPAIAATDPELAQIREEIKQVKDAYEARIQALEKRLNEAEAKTENAEENTAKAETAAASAQSPRGSANAFNPAISLILQGTYANFSEDPGTRAISGFIPSGGEFFPNARGLSLAESELNLSASIDPYFQGLFTAALTPEDEVEIEEAWISTLGLGGGFTVKAGRFFSGIGYLNEIHQHAFDFVDFPLAYTAFLGGNYGDDGVQVKWLAPTDLFIEFGAEAGRGRAFPGSDRNKNGIASGAAFVHIGDDIGESHSYRTGVSYLRTSPRERGFEDVDSLNNPAANAFSGASKLWIADFVYKFAPNGNSQVTNFKLQGEYFRRKEDGSLSFNDNAGSGIFGTLDDTFSSRQSGWYAQAVYQFMPRWRFGLRYDRLDSGKAAIGLIQNGTLSAGDFPLLAAFNPKRASAMLDFSPSEFSRLRLQYARDESRLGGVEDHKIFLQYIVSLGAHGAHRF